MKECRTGIYMVVRRESGYGYAFLDTVENVCFLTEKEASAYLQAQRNPDECEIIQAQIMAYIPAVITPAVMMPVSV